MEGKVRQAEGGESEEEEEGDRLSHLVLWLGLEAAEDGRLVGEGVEGHGFPGGRRCEETEIEEVQEIAVLCGCVVEREIWEEVGGLSVVEVGKKAGILRKSGAPSG